MFPDTPTLRFGELIEVAPGICGLRLPLPIALDHVNVYLLEDFGGWTLFDTGIADDTSWTIWQQVFDRYLGGRPIVRIVASHFHVDHCGLAGRLAEHFGCPLFMTETEYLMARLTYRAEPMTAEHIRTDFFLQSGASPAAALQMSQTTFRLMQFISALPPRFQRLSDGDSLDIGGRAWRVYTGRGHSPEQLMLHDPAQRVFMAADQVLPEITPNVSVWPTQPDADPLGEYLASLERLGGHLDDPLVLPCHRHPFRGLSARTQTIVEHHHRRCNAILEACGDASRTCFELVPVVFGRRIEGGVMDLAIGEALAHINYLCAQGKLRRIERDGTLAYRTL